MEEREGEGGGGDIGRRIRSGGGGGGNIERRGGRDRERERVTGGSCNKKREECLGAERGLGRVICKP